MRVLKNNSYNFTPRKILNETKNRDKNQTHNVFYEI